MILGLVGYAGCGKDTVGAEIIRLTGQKFQRVAFADALKADLDSPLYRCMGLDIKANPADKRKAREVLVAWGRLGRSIDPDYWIKRLVIPAGISVVVTDVRYANEAKWIKKQKGMVVAIARAGVTPANDEEKRSIREIMFHRDKIVDWSALNREGKVDECAREILDRMGDGHGYARMGEPWDRTGDDSHKRIEADSV